MQVQKPSFDHSNGNEAVSPSRLMGQDEGIYMCNA